MAEGVNFYNLWSSPCSLRIECAVQKALPVEIHYKSTEENLANKSFPLYKYCPFHGIFHVLAHDHKPVLLKTLKSSPILPEDYPYNERARADRFKDKELARDGSTKMRIVRWKPPPISWIKVNTDGSWKENSGLSACGGVFRSSTCKFLGGFSVRLSARSAFEAELMGVLHAISEAHRRKWFRLWIESDCSLVVDTIRWRKLDLRDPSDELKNLWNDCLEKIASMEIYCSHIFREGNKVADVLAKLGLKYRILQWWNDPPIEIKQLLEDDDWGLPDYRFFKPA